MPHVHVRGVSVRSTWADATHSLPEEIFMCVTAALHDAQTAISEIDAVVLAAHDLVDGRSLTNMVTAPAAGAYLKDETRIGDDGATAFILGDARVRSGSAHNCLVVAWGRASEGPADEIAHALFDPFLTRPLAMTEIGVSGLRATRALSQYHEYGVHRERAAQRRDIGAASGPRSRPAAPWPLRPQDLSFRSDLVAAAILGEGPGAIEVLGAGMGTEPFYLGDRDLLALPALRSASDQALQECGLGIEAIEILELDAMTVFDEALALEAVRAAPAGHGMRTLALDPRLKPYESQKAGYCAPAMGLVRVVRAVERLRGGDGRTALASGSSVVAAQTQAAIVLGRTDTDQETT